MVRFGGRFSIPTSGQSQAMVIIAMVRFLHYCQSHGRHYARVPGVDTGGLVYRRHHRTGGDIEKTRWQDCDMPQYMRTIQKFQSRIHINEVPKMHAQSRFGIFPHVASSDEFLDGFDTRTDSGTPQQRHIPHQIGRAHV